MSPSCSTISGCGPAHIVGNSAGGYLGQQLAMNQPRAGRSLMLFGSTPGLKNSQAPSWIPQIQAKGMRGFLAETIRRPAAARRRSGPRRMVSRRSGQERPGLYRQVRAADGELRLERGGRAHRVPDAGCRVPGAETVGSLANYEPFRRLRDVEFRVYDGRRTISATPSPTAAPPMCWISCGAAFRS